MVHLAIYPEACVWPLLTTSCKNIFLCRNIIMNTHVCGINFKIWVKVPGKVEESIFDSLKCQSLQGPKAGPGPQLTEAHFSKVCWTSMHFSKMRTARLLHAPPSMHCSGEGRCLPGFLGGLPVFFRGEGWCLPKGVFLVSSRGVCLSGVGTSWFLLLGCGVFLGGGGCLTHCMLGCSPSCEQNDWQTGVKT